MGRNKRAPRKLGNGDYVGVLLSNGWGETLGGMTGVEGEVLGNARCDDNGVYDVGSETGTA
jgi:hypothetical protein